MSRSPSIPRWLLARWKAFLTIVLICLSIAGLSALVTIEKGSAYSAYAAWPTRLSAESETQLPVTLSPYGRDIALEEGELYLFRGLSAHPDDVPADVRGRRYEELAKGRFDSEGRAILTIPAVEPLDGEGTEYLVLHTNVGGQPRWYRSAPEPVDEPNMALTLDRPLYQPGQTIAMRALVASATTGRPVDSEVTFRVRDAKSNLVFEEAVETGANGVAAAEFDLASRCVQGNYTIELTRGSSTVTKGVEVRPFRLPRFEVGVVTETSTVEPGGVLEGRIEANYTYGEPVRDAAARLTVDGGEMLLPDVSGTTDDAGNLRFEVSIPPNAPPGASLDLTAMVTSAAGRAERGTATARVSGRRVTLEIVPSRQAHLHYDTRQKVYGVLTDAGGRPVGGVSLKLVIPEWQEETELDLVTDEEGRVAFEWTPNRNAGTYVSARATGPDGEVLLEENVHVNARYGLGELRTDASVVEAGGTLTVELDETPALVVLSRDGVVLSAVRSDDGRAELPVPHEAVGMAQIGLLRRGSAQESVPIWVRQPGGEKVEIDLEEDEVRPGMSADVSLQFPPGEAVAGEGSPVTFGLVGVDEALYALKERADVPLHVLMRRAPEVIGDALRAFDGVAHDDDAGLAIATSRFRSRLEGYSPHFGRHDGDVTTSFLRQSRRGFQTGLLIFFLLGALGVVVQMGRWTWSVTERSLFSWRRLGAQVGFVLFCGFFAALIGVGGGEAWAGGLAVWTVVAICWFVAAAARLPDLPFEKWLAAHLIAAAFLGGAGVLIGELSRGSGSAYDGLLFIAIGLPLTLTAIQWIVWAFVLLREGETQSGLALASFFGIFTLGLVGFATMGGQSAKYKMAASTYQEESREIAPVHMAHGGPEGGVVSNVTFASSDSDEPVAGAAEAPTPAAATSAPRVRSWFPETMVWLPEIASDSDGRASVQVEVPDSITTWRLDAWANTRDGRFGQGEARLLAVKPYFVELDLPTEVTAGDRFEVPVTLVNRSGDPLTVDLTASAEGALALRGAPRFSRRLAVGERSIVWLRLHAIDVGDANVTVSSTTAEGVDGDAVRRTVVVRPDGRVLRESFSGIVDDGWETTVTTPRDTIRNTRVGEVRLYPSLVADALSGLEGMLRQPGGCFEQTSSSNYPNVMILRALRDTEPENWPGGVDAWQEAHDEASYFVRLGYQRMLTFQEPDGGFALYPGPHSSSEVMLTAYGIMQLVWAKDVTTVDDAVIRRAANWLASQQNADGSWPVMRKGVTGSASRDDTDIGRVRATAFVVMALAATEDPEYRLAIERALARIGERIGSVESANALAFAANAFADAGAKEGAKEALTRLTSMVTRDGDVAFWKESHRTWMGAWSTYASRETTAVAAQALIAAEVEVELMQPVLNYIAGNRGPWGGWGSTQTTIWTLRALESLRSKTSDESTLRFYWNSEQLQTVGGEESLEVTREPQPMKQFSFVPAQNEGRFVVDASAETAAMVQLVSEYAVSWESRHANLDGEPFAGDLELATRELRRGQTVRAYARVENVMQNDASMVIIEMPVPPGAFVPNDALDDLVEKGAVDMYEILPTHVRLYVSEIAKKDERVYGYDFIPLVRGTFSLPPLRAYPFYSPEPTTEVDAGDVRVR